MPSKELFHCANCGKEVWQYRSQIGQKVHCSRECRDATARGRPGPRKGHRTYATKACAQCGQDFQIWPASLLNKRTYCSRACQAAAARGS